MQSSPQKNTFSTAHKNSTPQSRLVEIEREYDVPVRDLFVAFKTADAIKAWWWPQELYADHVEIDFRQGGHYFINMKGSDIGGSGMTGQFEEIIENKLIVMSDHFADEKGRAITAQEAKMPGVWPEKDFITLEFDAVGEKSSRLRLSQEGIPNEAQKDCIQGWSEMFEKLENYLDDRTQ